MTTILIQQCHIKITVFWASMHTQFRKAIAILSELTTFFGYIALVLPLLWFLCTLQWLEKQHQVFVNGFALWRLR